MTNSGVFLVANNEVQLIDSHRITQITQLVVGGNSLFQVTTNGIHKLNAQGFTEVVPGTETHSFIRKRTTNQLRLRL
ncbi:MAG: hypothetical protein HRU24_18325 [Gammaproteobacteria bacterium]|nr:hypothetical protein [Gammaproteobacteria bacterium]